jgi:hypothetical protein
MRMSLNGNLSSRLTISYKRILDMSDCLKIDAKIGNFVAELIERETGEECRVIIIAFPAHGKDVRPTFITDLDVDQVESTIIQIAEGFSEHSKVCIDSRYIVEDTEH